MMSLKFRTLLCHSKTFLCHSSPFLTSICHWRISPVDVGGCQQKPITMIISHAINWCVVCDAAIKCTIRELWDSMFGLHPTDLRLEWRLQNREHLVPYLKTSPMDWLNYYVSWWWLTSPQLKLQIIILKMWAESCSVRCKQLAWCKETIIWHVLSCLWQDQLVFFNLVKAVDAWDWDSDKTLQVHSTGRRTWWGMRRVERREQFEIERNSGCSARAIQVANNRGRWLPQIQIFWSVARAEESRSQATVLGIQQWRLHCLQNMVRGPPQHGMFRSALMWNTVTRLKRACAGVETARHPCRYSEHHPIVGRLSILRKCLVRAMSPKRDGGGHTSENRGVETYA